MSVEYTPVDIACNLKCTYCYQEPMRDAGNISSPLNWVRAKDALIRQNSRFTIFGGEPLLAPIDHLEEVFKLGLERFGGNGIQTNGTLIEERHIELFKKYRVGVGISCDGPDSCSDLRRSKVVQLTGLSTDATLDSIERLCQAGIIPSIIVTVHKMNGLPDSRTKLYKWFDKLESIGIRHINLHMLEVEKGMEEFALSEEENTEAFRNFYFYSLNSTMEFAPFADIRKLLTDGGQTSCIWNTCDPLTTRAVQGVSRDGTLRNCGRTNKDGINWVKADTPGLERYIVLRETPQAYGGCKDCRFFVFCKGNCPGTAIDGDWRNRSVHCSTWFDLFYETEQQILREYRLPVSRMKIRMDQLMRSMFGERGVEVTWLS